MAQQKLTKGYMGLKANNSKDLTFQYNPTTISRNRRATYAKNTAAYADFPNSPNGAPPSLEWLRNEPEDIQIDIFLHVDGDKTVDDQLKKLDEFMVPEKSTGQPPDLILVMGRADRVRITEKNVVEKLFTPGLGVQEATVNLRLTALKSRSR